MYIFNRNLAAQNQQLHRSDDPCGGIYYSSSGLTDYDPIRTIKTPELAERRKQYRTFKGHPTPYCPDPFLPTCVSIREQKDPTCRRSRQASN